MKIKAIQSRVMMLALLLYFCFVSGVSAEELTDSAGIINGTPPIIYNDKHEAGKVSFKRSNIVVDDDDELDINDAVEMAWTVKDAEGDVDITLPTVEWICTDAGNNQHVLARGVNHYAILPADKGCTLGVNITPTTMTGAPKENEKIAIHDISAYDGNDNIPTGPVNPHSMNIIGYLVAPGNNNASYFAATTSTLHTAFAGARLQLETDNPVDQLNWTTSNAAIATVSDTGLVTIKAKGPFKITARHNEVRASIVFNPQKFFIFNTQKTLNWNDAKAWCENQGYRMPTRDELSKTEGKREVPSDVLWQEWGSSMNDVPHTGIVLWSSTEMVASQDAYAYMYITTGHVSSNTADKPEGVTCIVP